MSIHVGQVMDREPEQVTPDWPLADAARLMRSKGRRRLAVVSGTTGRVVGVLREEEVLRALHRPEGALEREIRAVIGERPGLDPEAFLIEVDDGVVTLVGSVGRTSDALELLRLVRSMHGVVELVWKVTPRHSDVVLLPAG